MPQFPPTSLWRAWVPGPVSSGIVQAGQAEMWTRSLVQRADRLFLRHRRLGREDDAWGVCLPEPQRPPRNGSVALWALMLPSSQASDSISHSHSREGLQPSSPGPDRASVSFSGSPGPSTVLTWCFPRPSPNIFVPWLRLPCCCSFCYCCLVVKSCPSLKLHGLQPARLLCPCSPRQKCWSGLPCPSHCSFANQKGLIVAVRL